MFSTVKIYNVVDKRFLEVGLIDYKSCFRVKIDDVFVKGTSIRFPLVDARLDVIDGVINIIPDKNCIVFDLSVECGCTDKGEPQSNIYLEYEYTPRYLPCEVSPLHFPYNVDGYGMMAGVLFNVEHNKPVIAYCTWSGRKYPEPLTLRFEDHIVEIKHP